MAAPALTTTERAERGLSDLVTAARQALGDTLDSIVLFGSAAEGRLRAASDVNVVLTGLGWRWLRGVLPISGRSRRPPGRAILVEIFD